MVNTTSTAEGGGTTGGPEWRVRIENATGEQALTAYAVEFTDGIVSSENTNQADNPVKTDEQTSQTTAEGGVGTGYDVWTGNGTVTVANLGQVTEDRPASPLTVTIGGESMTLAANEQTRFDPQDRNGDGRRFEDKTEPTLGGSDGIGGIVDLVPGLLPGIGPLNSSQTTAASIVLGLAIVGAVVK